MPMRIWRALVREPLVLFFAIGGLLFAVAPRDRAPGHTDGVVHLSRSSLESLVAAEARRQHVAALPPNVAAGVRAQAIDDELLYREGLRVGVDRNDNIVRQRVIEKMQLLAEDLAGSSRPVSDDELERYRAAHARELMRPAAVSFVHVFSSNGAAPLATLALPPGPDDQPPAVGDAFALGRRVVDANADVVRQRYGAAIADAVFHQPLGVWSAPLPSPYGFHRVKVFARHEGGPPSLNEVRGTIQLAYLQERRAHANADLLRSIRARYHVVVDDHAGALPAHAGMATSSTLVPRAD